jgi:hypothetical protein
MPITQIASLATVKQFMRIPNTNDDATIQILMNAAQAAIEREVGHIVSKPVMDRYDGGSPEIWLREKPVLFVSNVEEGWGYYDWELDDQEVNSIPALSIWAYSLDNPEEGLLTRRAAGNVLFPFVSGRNNIRVDYTVGRQVMPPNAVLAFCTLVSIWYRETQLRMTQNGAGSAIVFNAQNADFTRTTGESSINLGVPVTIIEMLNPDRRRPVFG